VNIASVTQLGDPSGLSCGLTSNRNLEWHLGFQKHESRWRTYDFAYQRNRIEDVEVAPPRRPNHLKILAGEREDRINRNQPLPAESTIVPPVKLSKGAQEVWDRLAPDLIDKGVLTSWDVDLFAVYCDAAAAYYECSAAMGSSYAVKGSVRDTTVKNPLWRVMRDCADTMRSIGGKFGLTPSDRAGIDVNMVEKKPTTGPERILG
jgi:P27 family predicted phage terminase small subunit